MTTSYGPVLMDLKWLSYTEVWDLTVALAWLFLVGMAGTIWLIRALYLPLRDKVEHQANLLHGVRQSLPGIGLCLLKKHVGGSEKNFIIVYELWTDDYAPSIGMGEDPVRGQPHWEYLGRIEHQWDEVHRRVWKTGRTESKRIDYFTSPETGLTYYFSWVCSRWTTPEGEPIGIAFHIVDRSPEVRENESLRQSVQKLMQKRRRWRESRLDDIAQVEDKDPLRGSTA